MSKTPYSYQKICLELFSDVSPRTKDILARRFGLNNSRPSTLEAIGKEHGITRERVRQIVEDGIRFIQDKVKKEKKGNPALPQVLSYFADILKKEGNLKREDLFVQLVGTSKDASHILFLLNIGEGFEHSRETDEFHPFWATKSEYVDSASHIHDALLAYLEKIQNPLPQEELHGAIFGGVSRPKNFTPASLLALLESSKHILQSYNGKWGLRSWPEVNPKGVREKAYIVLRNGGQPLHFMEIAEKIQELQRLLPDNPERKILPQTVHNELIKDTRFILVGRGVYALSEWGYKEGTVKDIMVAILREIAKPLSREELMQLTLQQRQVRESTILLNLQDKTTFMRTAEGDYTLKA